MPKTCFLFRSLLLWALLAGAIAAPAQVKKTTKVLGKAKAATTSAPLDSVRVTFALTDSLALSATTVGVAGSFNDWHPERLPLRRTGPNQWEGSRKLWPGWYYYKLVVDGKTWVPDPANPKRINDGGSGFNSVLKVGTPPVPKRAKTAKPLPIAQLPKPILEGYDVLVQLYYKAWEMAWSKIGHGTKANGFAASYMDEGFNELIYQWDTCFLTLFGLYGRDAFPALESLDNFYRQQRPDGYIQRVYQEADGKPAHAPTAAEPMINPPLFAWVEWRAFQHTADTARLRRVLPVLVKHYDWLQKNVQNRFGYYTTPLGSGMDNTPRPALDSAGAWVDLTGQMALAARSLTLIASATGDAATVLRFREEHDHLTYLLNRLCWDDNTGFYHDVRADSSRSPVLHIGGFWPLVAGVTDAVKSGSLAGHLLNPTTFGRPVPVPSLSYSDPAYAPRGHYWRGGVWAPTTYMVAAGLRQVGRHEQARDVAGRYLWTLANTYKHGAPDPDSVAYEQRFADGYHTLWEAYAPERAAPATRWDNTFYTRQDFAGWTGLGPIALLFEDIIGLDLDAPRQTIRWRIYETTRIGVERLAFGRQHVTLIAEPAAQDCGRILTVQCEKAFRLVVESCEGDVKQEFYVPRGKHKLRLQGK